MKKLFLFLVMMGFALFGVAGVIAAPVAEHTQNTDVFILADLSLTPTPTSLSFGNLIPGGESIQQVTLMPGTSDLSVSVAITGEAPLLAIQYDFSVNGTYLPYHGANFMLPNSVAKTFDTKLTIPAGTRANKYNGLITYTVNEYVPLV